MVSPPKPWEAGGAAAATTMPTTTATTDGTAPALPARPATMTSAVNPASTSYASPYSSYGGGYNRFGSTYGSPYGSYGGYGSSMYGGGMGYGGYGGMGYGGGGYGMGMGMGMGGPMGMMDPNNPSLTQALESSTAQTFAVLQSIVQTFGGFAQMLESTFMATHSSFFAMVGVAEQLGNLRNALGTVLGLFGLMRWLRDVLTGRRSQPPGQGEMGKEFAEFMTRPPGSPAPQSAGPRPSRKPLVIFLMAMVGIPYLMHRLIRTLQSRLPPPSNPTNPLDPNTLPFARALYTFASSASPELSLQKGDIVAVLQTADPVSGIEGEWWMGRNRSGEEGWFPRNYVEIVKRPGEGVKIEQVAKTVD